MLSFFSRGVLDEMLNLIESVSEGFPSYSLVCRGYLLFEVNTKYISSNVLKISVISRVRSEISDIFNIRDQEFLVYLPKKGKFSFLFFCLGKITENKPQ